MYGALDEIWWLFVLSSRKKCEIVGHPAAQYTISISNTIVLGSKVILGPASLFMAAMREGFY